MPYVIAFVIIIVAAGALLLFRQPAEAPALDATASTQEAVTAAENEAMDNDPIIEIEADAALEVSQTEDEDFDPADDRRTFTAEASYLTPKRTEHDIVVSLTLKDRVVVDADVTYDGGAAQTPAHSGFDGAYKSEVIGKTLNEISLSRVGGASLTSDAFNEAVAEIRSERS